MAYNSPTGNIRETVCPIWVRDGRRPGYEVFGSSVLCGIGEDIFIVSAAHVLNVSATGDIFIGFPSGFMEIVDTPFVTQNPSHDHVDVGFIRLNAQAANVIRKHYGILPLGWMTVEDGSTAGLPYRVFGTPSTKVKRRAKTFSPNFTDLLLFSHPAEKYEQLGLETDRHIALEFARDRMLTPQKRQITAPDPRGMSGSPVWKLIQTEQGGKPVSTFRLAGILTEYRRPKKSLVATRISAVLEGIRFKCPALAHLIPGNLEIPILCREVNQPNKL